MIVVLDDIESELAAGRLSCRCDGRLAPWGHARLRIVRQRNGAQAAVRPRRGRCVACRRTAVLLPAHALPRRRDATEVIGAAVYLAARARGHRSVAEQLARPSSTVRSWLRRARNLAEQLYAHGLAVAHELDPLLASCAARGAPLANAVEVLAVMARASMRRLGVVAISPWRIIVFKTGGLLLARTPSD